MAKEIQDQFADVDIFDDLTIREQPEGMKVVDALLDLKNRLNLQQGDSLSENIDNAIESLMLEEINKRQNFLRVRKNPEMPEKQSYILEKELPVDVFEVFIGRNRYFIKNFVQSFSFWVNKVQICVPN